MALDGLSSLVKQAFNVQRIAYLGNSVAGHFYCKPMASTPVGTVEGRVYFDDAANGLKQADGSVFHALSDREFIDTRIIATDVDRFLFIADRAYIVTGVRYRPSVAGTDGGAVTAVVRKCTGTQSPTAGTPVHSGTINLKGTVNTNQTAAMSVTASDWTLAAGDSLSLDVTGVLTVVEGLLTVTLEQA